MNKLDTNAIFISLVYNLCPTHQDNTLLAVYNRRLNVEILLQLDKDIFDT